MYVTNLIIMKKEKIKTKKLTVTRITCSKCREQKKTTKKQMERLTATFGSLEAVHEKYHCIKCRKEYNVRKDGRAKPVKNKREEKPKFNGILPEWMRGKNNRYDGKRYWVKPESVSSKKWSKAILNAITWGINRYL